MKISTFIKTGIGLVYTTILMAITLYGVSWATQFLIKLTWVGAILFWLIGVPIVIGLFQAIAALAAIPAVYLLKGAKWLGWLLVLPMLFFIYTFGAFLWKIASSIGGVLTWLLMISWFCETAWLFVAYLQIAIGSAYDTDKTEDLVAD